jgi:hypothetical protein
MPADTTIALAEIDAALARYQEVEDQWRQQIGDEDHIVAPRSIYGEIVTRLEETIRRWAPDPDYGNRALKTIRTEYGYHSDRIRTLAGIVRNLHHDWETGRLRTFRERVQADVFSDFLGMAEYLMEDGLAAPAAGLAGGVLEQHVRKLCAKHGVAVDARAPIDPMNVALTRADVYGRNEQHQVRQWGSVRNEAAHGNHGNYRPEQVKAMIQGIRHFISAYPA